MHGFPAKVQAARMAKGPRMKCITASRVKVGFESSVGMNRVEVTALLACDFEVDDLRRREVKLRRRKSLTQMGDVLVAQKYHEVHIVSQTRFAIENRGHAPADDIPHPQPIQRAKEQKAKVRFGHG